MSASVTEMYLVACLLPECVDQRIVGAAALDIVTVRQAADGLGWTFADLGSLHLSRLGRCPNNHVHKIHQVAAVLPTVPPGRPNGLILPPRR